MAQDGIPPCATSAPPSTRPHPQGQQLPRSKAQRIYRPYRGILQRGRSHLILYTKTCWTITENHEGRTIGLRHQYRKRRTNGGFLKFLPRLQSIPEEEAVEDVTLRTEMVGRRRTKVGRKSITGFCKYLALFLIVSGVGVALFKISFWGVVRFVVGVGVVWCRARLTL